MIFIATLRKTEGPTNGKEDILSCAISAPNWYKAREAAQREFGERLIDVILHEGAGIGVVPHLEVP